MKISVITATYNSESSIRECLDSMALQTFPAIEHIIVDGGSSDQSLTFIKNFPQHQKITRKIIEGPDNGIYDALNKGIKEASGEIIGILHSDDLYFSPGTLDLVSGIFENRDIDGVYGDLVFFGSDESDRIVRYWKSSDFKFRNLGYGWTPPHPSLFLRREVYMKHGPFNTEYAIAGDYDFMIRIFKDKGFRFHYLDQPLVRMRMGGVSTGGSWNLLQKSMEDYRILKRNKMPFPLWTLGIKIARKLPQFVFRPY